MVASGPAAFRRRTPDSCHSRWRGREWLLSPQSRTFKNRRLESRFLFAEGRDSDDGMNYGCCFCGEIITTADGDALRLTFNSLWKPDNDPDPSESIWAHRQCILQKVEPLLRRPLDVEVLPIQKLAIVR